MSLDSLNANRKRGVAVSPSLERLGTGASAAFLSIEPSESEKAIDNKTKDQVVDPANDRPDPKRGRVTWEFESREEGLNVPASPRAL